MRTTRDFIGPVLFVLVTFLLTWGTAAITTALPRPTLLTASLLYVALVGWQPLVALALVRRVADDERSLDHGRHAIEPRFAKLAIVAPIVLLVAAAACHALLFDNGTRGLGAPAWQDDLVASTIAFCIMIAVLWFQALAEEVAWRGYLLPRLMRRLGGWPGLLVHGALWGACYAPVFLVGGNGDPMRIAGFIVTCGLLGVLLGWLRLASRSIYASAASNATLTICAGLPLALQGFSSPFGAVFEPIGWLPMVLAIALIAARSSLRSAIAVPERPIAEHVN